MVQCKIEAGILVVVVALQLHCDPLLGHHPVVVKDTRSVYVHILANQIFVFNPEELLVSKIVIESFQPLGGPFFGRITPRTLPFTVVYDSEAPVLY